MTTPQLIALTGPAGAGKDSVADCLHHLAGFHKMAFAAALYAEVCAAFAVPMKYLTTRETKELPMAALALAQCYDGRFVQALAARNTGLDLNAARSPRWVLQRWGTEYRRAQDLEYWLKRFEAAIDQRGPGPIVITDCRFANEAALVRRLGGVIWRLERPGFDVATDHASDVSGREFAPEAVIVNDGSLDELGISVMHALEMGRVAV